MTPSTASTGVTSDQSKREKQAVPQPPWKPQVDPANKSTIGFMKAANGVLDRINNIEQQM